MSVQLKLIAILCIVPACQSDGPNLFQYMIKTHNLTDENYNPTYGYEPYWVDGDWVYKEEELPPGVTTTPVPLVCGEECNYLYRSIGEVCGRVTSNRVYSGCNPGWFRGCWGESIDNFSGGFTTFETYCKFLDAQCRSPFYSRWILVHSGPCVKDHDMVFKGMEKPEYPISRITIYYSRLTEVFQNITIFPYHHLLQQQ